MDHNFEAFNLPPNAYATRFNEISREIKEFNNSFTSHNSNNKIFLKVLKFFFSIKMAFRERFYKSKAVA